MSAFGLSGREKNDEAKRRDNDGTYADCLHSSVYGTGGRKFTARAITTRATARAVEVHNQAMKHRILSTQGKSDRYIVSGRSMPML